jgi:uncharacterized protein (TIGR02145 family)
MTNYAWTVSAGGSITAGGTASDNTVTVTWTTAGAQSVSVNYNDANNCPANAPFVYNVTVHPLPLPAITGTAVYCAGASGAVYSAQPGMTNYAWTVSAGGNITGGGGSSDNTVTVTWTTAGAQTVSVNYQDANGCTAVLPSVYNITVNPLPVPTLIGTAVVCAGATGEVYSTQPGMTNYAWVVSAGGSITAGGTAANSTVTVTWNTPGPQSVSINYNSPAGCTATSAFVFPVTVNSLPVPTISGTNSLCEGTTGVVYSTQPGKTNYSWTVSAGGSITSGGTPADNTVTVAWSTAGPQTVSVNYNDANGCTAVAPISYPVTVHALPVPAILGSGAVCAGASGVVYSTQPGMTGYLWAVSAGGTITAGGTVTSNTVTVTWNTAGPQTVSVNYTDANGCTASASVVYNVTVNALPVPAIGGPASVCVNSITNYSTAVGMTGYVWTVSAGGNITAGSGTSSISVQWTTTGSKTITVSYQDGNGCSPASPASYAVTVNLLPVPALTGANQICVGNSVLYSTDAGMLSYSWSVSAGGSVTSGGGNADNTVTVLWNSSGAQTISVNYVMGTGCTAPSPSTLNVTVHPLPVPVISGTNALCAGATGNIYSTLAGMTNYQWAVSAGGNITAGGSVSDPSVTVTWNTAGARSVSVNYVDPNGCTAPGPVSYPVTINALPVPALTGPGAVCLNTTSIYFTDPGMSSYIWSVSAGGSITAGMGTNSITVFWSTTGTKNISVNYTDANSCSALVPSSLTVNVSNLPVPSLNGLNTVCKGIPEVYSTDAGMTGYSWTVSAGGTINSGGGAADNTVTVTWNVAGAQSVSVNYQAGPGCSASLPTVLTVTVKPRPGITNAGNSSLCSATTLSITPIADLPGTTFSWTATPSSGNITGYTSTGGPAITDHLVNTGFSTESVTYAVLPSLNGCDGNPSNFMVTVFPVADVIFNPAGQSFCSGGNTSISLTSNVALPTFSWTASGSSGNINGFGPGSGNSISQTLNNTSFVNQTATYHVTPAASGCPGTAGDVVVNVLPLPQVIFPPCFDISTTTDARPFALKGATPAGGTYSGTGVSSGIFDPAAAGTGTHSIVYTSTSSTGCSNTASLNITVYGASSFTCGNTLTDIRDNAQYPTIKIGTQCWIASNLNFGNTIPSTAMQRDNCTVEKYCFYDNSANCTSLGGLYQWDEVMAFDAAPGIRPPAWHLPTENEWTTLFNFYTSNGFAGSPLKASGFSGFNAILSGVRFDNANWYFSPFATFFWSSDSHGPSKAWAHSMNEINPSVSNYPGNRSNAFSVRCIKD